MNRVAIFDTETTGFPSKKVGPRDPAQNVVVELGVLLYNMDTEQVEQQMSVIIQTPEPEVPQFLVDNVHGISNELSLATGVSSHQALKLFVSLMKTANWQVVGHNVKFDIDMMCIMLERDDELAHHTHDMSTAESYCTMAKSKHEVGIPPTAAMLKAGRNEPKAPKLEEAYLALVGEPMGDAHRVHVDCMATLAVFKELKKRGL